MATKRLGISLEEEWIRSDEITEICQNLSEQSFSFSFELCVPFLSSSLLFFFNVICYLYMYIVSLVFLVICSRNLSGCLFSKSFWLFVLLLFQAICSRNLSGYLFP